MTHPQPHGGAQTKPQAIGPDKHKSCESAMLLSGGPPVPHPDLYDRQSSPQQMRDYGSILGTPRSHWAGSKQHFPILEELVVSCLFIFAHPSAPHSLLYLVPVLDRCHPAVFAEREGYPYVEGWTTHADSSSLRNPSPDTHVPTGRACPCFRPGSSIYSPSSEPASLPSGLFS